jgi:hypothetical protein
MKHTLIATVMVGVALGVAGTSLRGQAQEDPQAKAQAVLVEVTKAMGGDKAAGLKSLSAEGEFRRTFGQREISGAVELYAILPDIFQQVTVMERPDGMPGMRMSMTMNGDDAFRDQSGGGGFMRFGGGPGGPGGGPGGPGGPGGGPGGPGGPGGQRMDPAVQIRAELYRVLLGVLPGNPALSKLSYAWVARAESPNGAADVIDVTGPDNFKARLFIDENTRLPLMLSFQQRQPMQRMAPPADLKTQEERRAWFEEQRAKMAAAGPPPMVEARVFFADYQETSGVMFPHRITRQVNGQVQEQITIEKYKVNPSLKATQFQKKSSN